MPEEVNRVVVDRLSDLCLTPSADADENLRAEGVPAERIVRVGNVMIDSLERALPASRRIAPELLGRLGVEPGGYALATLHRPANVDDPLVLGPLLSMLITVSGRLPVVFPVHPRTRARIDASPLSGRVRASSRLVLCDPLGYFEFQALMLHARLVLTDSGGVQEETTALGVPCLTLRDNTERPVTVTEGTNTLVGRDPVRIAAGVDRILAGQTKAGRRPALWDGHAADRVADALQAFLGG
jgi:UDP-N-acetylglucosamine 2-epimerase (non-hydrolysing)